TGGGVAAVPLRRGNLSRGGNGCQGRVSAELPATSGSRWNSPLPDEPRTAASILNHTGRPLPGNVEFHLDINEPPALNHAAPLYNTPPRECRVPSRHRRRSRPTPALSLPPPDRLQ